MTDPEAFLDSAAALAVRRARAGRPPILALAGSQGSGKSTMAKRYAEARGDVALLSLDDFYLSAARRADLARRVHPLLRTRGVPGTHDLDLLEAVLAGLAGDGPVTVPVFDKLADDLLPSARWRTIAGRPALILIEGWCLGALPQPEAALAAPVNALERERDRDGAWRRLVNARLAGPYAALFARFDALAFLRAPSFETVLGWRVQQQETLLGRAATPEERAQVADFLGYFERITRHMLAGGVKADAVARLAPDRAMRPEP